MKLSLCIPMYNEKLIIRDTAETLCAYLSKNFSNYELIFIDDGSTDGSAELVRALKIPEIRVLAYQPNKGKGCAVRTGVTDARGDIVMFIDADLAYGTDVIKQTCDLFAQKPDIDMIIGSRALHPEGYEGYTPLRKLASKVFILVLGLVGGFKLSDSQCGCKAFRGKAAKDIFARCVVNGFAFDFEVILLAQKLGLKIHEMPVKIINHRDSKVNLLKDTLRMLREIFKIKKRVGNMTI